MHTEIEAQFLDINKNALREKLKSLGAKLVQPEVLMKRSIFSLGPHRFLRVRDENSKIVMTYKNVLDSNSLTGTQEINLDVSSYSDAIDFLTACGFQIKAYQETLRETWHYLNSELCIDTWPWLPTFLEIEGPTPDEVWKISSKLGLNRNEASFGSADTIYQHYFNVAPDIVNNHTPTITFDCTPPDWVKPL